ncbi:MAG TPA: protein jag [Clostridiaceae bacterium]|nr:protein jag [Clostridiaceae bacterium]
MSNWVETTAKTVDLAIEQALATLGAGIDDVLIEVIEEGEAGGLLGFGKKPARVRVTLADGAEEEMTMPADIPLEEEADEAGPEPKQAEEDDAVFGQVTPELEDAALDYVQAIMQGLDIHGRIGSYIGEDGSLNIEVTGRDCGAAIGHHGETLDAIAYLTGLAVNRLTEDRVRVSLDIGGYRQRREKKILEVVNRTAERVRTSGQPGKLKPMTAAERRVVHLALKRKTGLTSYSQGVDPERYVVIAPED